VSKNPLDKGAQPPFPAQPQPVPGLESKMDPQPDYGERTYRGADKLKGKVALITGGDSGIGRAVALAFAREGADLVISYLSEHSDAQETVRIIEKEGRRCVAIPGDISEERHCIALVERTLGEFGRLDVLVNNAAFQMTHDRIEEFSSEEFDRTFKTNVYAMFWLCKAAVPHMKPGSSIINTTSIQSAKPSPTLLAYATTKGAIVNFTGGLSQMLADKGIRVNAVAPGPVWTPLIPTTMPQEHVKEFGKSAALQRPGQPAEIAPAYVLLASDDGSYITGAVVPVTGGQLMLP
jgi:NAD(P)-dependent dehydrogenase (short-subunit alcohol dehydrogenase family)